MSARRRVLVALGDPRLEGLVDSAATTAGLITRPCADLADLLAAAGAGLGHVAVVDPALAHLDRTALAALRRAQVRIVGVAGDDAGRARLRRLGVTTCVAAGPAGDVAGIARALTVSASGEAGPDGWREIDPDDLERWWSASAPDARGTVLAVWGPTGAPGRTTLAVTLAGCAVRRGATVLLVDLDPYGGSVAAALRLPTESPGVIRALRAADEGRLDEQELARAVVRTGGMDVLTGLAGPDRWPELRPAGVAGLLEVGRDLADLVVVDTGFCLEDDAELSYDTAAPRRNAATLTALEEADRVVAVGQPGPVGTPRLVAGLDELRRLRPVAPVTVVVNRVRASVLDEDGPISLGRDLARLAGVADPMFVPDDPLRADTALQQGRSLAATAPHSPMCRAVDAVLGGPAPGTSATGGAGRPMVPRV